MVGADGVEYGPATLKQIQEWATQARLTGGSLVQRSDVEGWSTASSFPELGMRDFVGTPGAEDALDTAESADLEKKIKNGGSWFYWIAGLSLISSICVLCGADWFFVAGLATTHVIDLVMRGFAEGGAGPIVKIVALVIDFAAAALFVTLGIFACKRQKWAFIAGIVLYGCDTLLTLVLGIWLGLFLHGWALVSLFVGLKAANRWNKLAKASAAASVSAPSAPGYDMQHAA
jgi:GYF domain 2